MSRLASAIRWDFRLQFRNGFYYASAFVAVVMIVLLRQLSGVDLGPWWPALILENLVINSFYFMSGLVLLEKGEGVLEALVVTPLRATEYLASKVLTLGALSIVETLAIVVLVSGFGFRWGYLVAGILFLMAMYALYGFVVVARYDSISEFLLPSALWTLGYSLPLLYYFDIWRSGWMFLHPMQAPLVLMEAAFFPVPGWQIAYGMGYSVLWTAVAFYASRRAFHRFVISKEGAAK